MKKYFNFQIKKVVHVNNLITLEHLELTPDFSYPDEVHDFYELAYVIGGSLTCNLGNRQVSLKTNDFLLIPPAVHHFYTIGDKSAATVFIACFGCKSDILNLMTDQIPLTYGMKTILDKIIMEAKSTFIFPFNRKLELLEIPSFGAQQLIENHIEELLIEVIRKHLDNNSAITVVMNSVELEKRLVNDVNAFLVEALRQHEPISLTLISEKTSYSKTHINNIFKKITGQTIIQTYNFLRFQEAQRYLRENIPTSVIAERLNYESPNHFSKVFKRYAGITPAQYRKKH